MNIYVTNKRRLINKLMLGMLQNKLSQKNAWVITKAEKKQRTDYEYDSPTTMIQIISILCMQIAAHHLCY